ncbi:3-hydroxyacyl-CoA dehydrogenase NAD-binding domain-containing protein [Nocardia camponoti]|uniref:Fatty oxidation protein FadB n=1 Tax=Nocardia camponoti TaxID=1616106 RepID=A0A917QPT8_9NOCA|nr:3-hydroxyacyl-CoA dehydrogenase NAD-binding domain-containing protein [Nocardia camponoti]GGK61140.1 putative fatty oxidation protein FadB [Nocardia camponoti]
MTDNIIGWEKDADGVVVLTIDDPSQGANTMNDAYINSMAATVDRLEAEKDDITGVIITSGKKTFFAGGDLKNMLQVGPNDAAQVVEMLDGVKGPLRRLEQLGKPVVAAINGAALGGGLEIALATHHRIAADVKGSAIGLPEVSLGLLPGGGGVTRVTRMLGLQNALMQVLLQGQRHRVTKAKEIGLVDEVVSSVDELIPAAKAWIAANPDAAQPWDKKGFRIPGGTPSTPAFAANLPAFPANLRKQIKGANMPAPRAIMAAAVEGAQVDIDNALTIEGRYFTNLLTGPVAKNMIQAFFFDLNHINGGGSRPKDVPKRDIKKIGVIGAGMMGAGIAYVSAKAGYEVVLKDVELAAAEKGKAYSEAIEAKALSRGKTTPEKSAELLARITPTADAADFKGVDFVIEAVFENPDLKNKVFQEIEDIVDPDALLGSNTSTLPITLLSEGVKRSEDFIGIHFFSPVDKMPLVEIIKGDNTSDEALARVYDYTLAIKKTPIVVNDSRGFFTSRVIGTFINEAIAMVAEGVDPSTVEQAGLQAGYPAAPLKLSDELNFTTMQKIAKETRQALIDAGREDEINAASKASAEVIDKLVDEFARKGKAGGAGFYDYVDGKATGIWDGLRETFNSSRELPEGVTFDDLKDRMMFAEAIETQKCFDEGVLTSTADANIGSIFGIGFPAWTGGSHQFIVGYPGGQEAFVARADELAAKFGPRFEVPASLRK